MHYGETMKHFTINPTKNLNPCLCSTEAIDSDNNKTREIARDLTAGLDSTEAKSMGLFHVRSR